MCHASPPSNHNPLPHPRQRRRRVLLDIDPEASRTRVRADACVRSCSSEEPLLSSSSVLSAASYKTQGSRERNATRKMMNARQTAMATHNDFRGPSRSGSLALSARAVLLEWKILLQARALCGGVRDIVSGQ